MLLGQTIPNNSLVNLNDLLYATNNNQPTNVNGLQTLMCVTDLEDCCASPRTVRGNWYYPDGRTVVFNTSGATFQSNRGLNEVIGNQQFYGSVRLWRRYTPPERGLFRCEIPDANGVSQNLYVNICEFPMIIYSPLIYMYCVVLKCMLPAVFFIIINGSVFVSISPSGSSTAGETYSLTCSAILYRPSNPSPGSYIMPPPTFEWLFGPNGNDPLPSGVTPTETVLGSDNTYRSILHFSPPSQFHTGNYTCRLGAGRLVNSAVVTVNCMPI